MNAKDESRTDFDEPLIWIYDPHFPASPQTDLARDPLAEFDRPMMVVDKKDLADLIERGHEIEFV